MEASRDGDGVQAIDAPAIGQECIVDLLSHLGCGHVQIVGNDRCRVDTDAPRPRSALMH